MSRLKVRATTHKANTTEDVAHLLELLKTPISDESKLEAIRKWYKSFNGNDPVISEKSTSANFIEEIEHRFTEWNGRFALEVVHVVPETDVDQFIGMVANALNGVVHRGAQIA